MPELLSQDEQHLKLLSIFHYVVGGLVILFACIFIFHLGMGILMLVKPEILKGSRGELPPKFLGVFFTALGGLVVSAGWSLGGCMIAAGRFLARRKNYTFCFVVAAIGCIFSPFGTVLGVFTLIVLSRPSVKALFNSTKFHTP
ncbi:MAG: hypothetical protein WC335_03795 [Candidatus Omnitrophota bacterium]|jgi:hypothetical protein